jgi:tetrahydromethanopterin S-methyltransferase subunit D
MVIGSILGGIIGALFYNKFFDVLLEEIDRHHYD